MGFPFPKSLSDWSILLSLQTVGPLSWLYFLLSTSSYKIIHFFLNIFFCVYRLFLYSFFSLVSNTDLIVSLLGCKCISLFSPDVTAFPFPFPSPDVIRCSYVDSAENCLRFKVPLIYVTNM